MASTISAGTTTTTALVQTADTSGVLQLQTNGTTTAVTIDTAQNMGLGVTPNAWGSGYKAVQIQSGAVYQHSSTDFRVIQNAYYATGNSPTYINTQAASMYRQDAGTHYWYNAPSGTAGNALSFSQAMTLDASSNLLVGTTTTVTSGGVGFSAQTDANGIFLARRTNTTSSNTAIYFYNPNGIVGSISTSGSLTSYTVSSDYRLKENIVPLTGALNKISALKPSLYNYKADPSTQIEGFIAHELAEIVPHAVTGAKDAVDEEGNPVYQGVDVSFLIPHLVASIQELSAQVTTLQTQVTALKG